MYSLREKVFSPILAHGTVAWYRVHFQQLNLEWTNKKVDVIGRQRPGERGMCNVKKKNQDLLKPTVLFFFFF